MTRTEEEVLPGIYLTRGAAFLPTPVSSTCASRADPIAVPPPDATRAAIEKQTQGLLAMDDAEQIQQEVVKMRGEVKRLLESNGELKIALEEGGPDADFEQQFWQALLENTQAITRRITLIKELELKCQHLLPNTGVAGVQRCAPVMDIRETGSDVELVMREGVLERRQGGEEEHAVPWMREAAGSIEAEGGPDRSVANVQNGASAANEAGALQDDGAGGFHL
ncbi:hypothetical protein HK101_011130 [Irineochytrium annulatum]|nr:hypothetical protein HK101_011130 [Irineochytrium annulatum]